MATVRLHGPPLMLPRHMYLHRQCDLQAVYSRIRSMAVRKPDSHSAPGPTHTAHTPTRATNTPYTTSATDATWTLHPHTYPSANARNVRASG